MLVVVVVVVVVVATAATAVVVPAPFACLIELCCPGLYELLVAIPVIYRLRGDDQLWQRDFAILRIDVGSLLKSGTGRNSRGTN